MLLKCLQGIGLTPFPINREDRLWQTIQCGPFSPVFSGCGHDGNPTERYYEPAFVLGQAYLGIYEIAIDCRAVTLAPNKIVGVLAFGIGIYEEISVSYPESHFQFPIVHDSP
jgi:hypothetical protein